MSYLKLDHIQKLTQIAKALETAPGPDDSEAPIVIGGILTREMRVEDISITALDCRDMIIGVYDELATLADLTNGIMIDLSGFDNPTIKGAAAKRLAVQAWTTGCKIRSAIRAALKG